MFPKKITKHQFSDTSMFFYLRNNPAISDLWLHCCLCFVTNQYLPVYLLRCCRVQIQLWRGATPAVMIQHNIELNLLLSNREKQWAVSKWTKYFEILFQECVLGTISYSWRSQWSASPDQLAHLIKKKSNWWECICHTPQGSHLKSRGDESRGPRWHQCWLHRGHWLSCHYKKC